MSTGGNGLFRPSERGRRNPTTDDQNNGPIVNPPRYAKLGGFTSANKGIKKNAMTIKKPGGTKA